MTCIHNSYNLKRRRPGLGSWVRKIPWRRQWQTTPVFLPGESLDRKAWRALGLVQRPPFSPDFGSSNFTNRSKSLTPQPEAAPWSGELGPPQRRCAQVARDSLPPSHKPPLPSVGLPIPPKLQSPGGGSLSRPSDELVASSVEFPPRKGPLYPGSSSYRKKKN